MTAVALDRISWRQPPALVKAQIYARANQDNDGPLSPYRSLHRREVGTSTTSSLFDPPNQKALSEETLQQFWDQIALHVRSVNKMEEDNGQEKAYEVKGMEQKDITLGKKGFYVSSIKGTKTKRDRFNQDSYTVIQLNTGEQIYVVCDGHGDVGEKIAQRVSRTLPYYLSMAIKNNDKCVTEKIIEWAFDASHSELIAFGNISRYDTYQSGCAVNVVLVDERTIWSAHVGDSRTMVLTLGQANVLDGYWVTEDHTPLSEKDRIEEKGGELVFYQQEESITEDGSGELVSKDGKGMISANDTSEQVLEDSIQRIYLKGKNYPGLRVSRVFGDLCLGNPGIVIHSPAIKGIPRTPDQTQLILIASDGVWEFTETSAVASQIENAMKTRHKLRLPINEGMAKIGSQIAKDAQRKWLQKGSYVDDVACVAAVINNSSS